MANVFQEAPQVVPVENTRVTDNGTSSVGSGADLSSKIWSEMQKTTGDSSANGQLGSTTSSDSNGDSLSQEKVKDSADKTLPSLELFDGQKDGGEKLPSKDSSSDSDVKNQPSEDANNDGSLDVNAPPGQELPKSDDKKDSVDPREAPIVPADPRENPFIPADPKEDQVIQRKS